MSMEINTKRREIKEKVARRARLVVQMLDEYRDAKYKQAKIQGADPSDWTQDAVWEATGFDLGETLRRKQKRQRMPDPEELADVCSYLKASEEFYVAVYQLAYPRVVLRDDLASRTTKLKELVSTMDVPAIVVDRPWYILEANTYAHLLFCGINRALPLTGDFKETNIISLIYQTRLGLADRIRGVDEDEDLYRKQHAGLYFIENSILEDDPAVAEFLEWSRINIKAFDKDLQNVPYHVQSIFQWQCQTQITLPGVQDKTLRVASRYCDHVRMFHHIGIITYPFIIWYEPIDAATQKYFRDCGMGIRWSENGIRGSRIEGV